MKISFGRFVIGVLISVISIGCATSKDTKPKTKTPPEVVAHKPIPQPEIQRFQYTYDSPAQHRWVDSIYNSLSFDERIGQLFMVAAYSNKDSVHVNSVAKLIKNNKIGGLIFFQGGLGRQAKLTNKFQAMSRIPMFIGIDAEWGLSMRLDSTYRYPYNMTLGAIKDTSLISKLGKRLGYESKRMGIQFNFAPVVDINTNPKNPIIGFRSFGESKEIVTNAAIALMKGVQSEGVLSTAKHFPGHGDTATDSHYALPLVNFSTERLNEVEFYPYKKLFDAGLSSVMVAHLNVPSLESRPNYPSSISYNIVTNILQKQLGFHGLVFTDALNMKAAANYLKPGEIDLEAFLAGNDILLFPENVPRAYEKICKAIEDSVISSERMEYSIRKILKFKYKSGLNKYKPIVTENLYNDLNDPADEALQYELFENAVTIVKNENNILPIKNLVSAKIAYVKMGDDVNSDFLSTLKSYADVTEVYHENIDSLNLLLKDYNTVIVGFHKNDKPWKNHDFSKAELERLKIISSQNSVILDIFTKPYSLLQIPEFTNYKAVVISYQNHPVAQKVSAEIIFGALPAVGRLPVSIGGNFKINDGIETIKTNILGFATPENVGMDSGRLKQIDFIAEKAISGKMTPGLQVLVARHGKVIFQKSYGYHTYDKNIKTANSDIYDIASLSKVVGTLPLVMQEYDEHKVNLDTQLSSMLPIFEGSNKATIDFKDLLLHNAQLQPWFAFYNSTLDENKKPSPKYYQKIQSADFSIAVADSLYLRTDYRDSLFKKIIDSNLLPKKEYKYSDFTFMILQKWLEKVNGEPLDILAHKNFFAPMGMSSTMYNPLRKFNAYVIVPTEIDNYFRYQKIQGTVHDMAAAMLGGVAGHAGVFSDAMDVAKIMQLYLQKGNYGGHQYFSEKTFDDFNKCYYCSEGNRRGLGFDKPQLPNTSGPTCGCVSPQSFGHTGFTGTMAWADPVSDIVYIFLSNRTFQGNGVNTLSKENIREDIQKIIQASIIK